MMRIFDFLLQNTKDVLKNVLTLFGHESINQSINKIKLSFVFGRRKSHTSLECHKGFLGALYL